ncbi:MAG: DUF448 domain-containing protein [Myxococcota bacterium]|jgi:predicted RNA-binding protein YlxR (DUF448 family)|nr:DUF448 domain-containing protein [Myxococcota bacterium]
MMQASIKPKPDNVLRTKPSVRTCVVCRESSPAKELLGLKVLNQMLVADEKVAGRGAWVHLRAACLDGLELDLLEKALRTKIDFENQKAWLTNLRLLAQKRVLECVGLARRSGKLLIGLDHIGKAKAHGSLVLCADDLADGSIKKCGAHARQFCSGDELGKAVGRQWAGVVGFCDVRHRGRAFFWWNLWEQLSFVA